MLMVASIFSLIACGPSGDDHAAEEAAEAVEATTEEVVEEIIETTTEAVELADHVCNDKCTADACHFTCGEKGHECTEACHAAKEGAEHTDADGHNHTEGEETAE